ncbi:MAG: hypothetical protein ABSA45_00515 [Verrucomicrobiota bacterium]|jgi:hypothetical protein
MGKTAKGKSSLLLAVSYFAVESSLWLEIGAQRRHYNNQIKDCPAFGSVLSDEARFASNRSPPESRVSHAGFECFFS